MMREHCLNLDLQYFIEKEVFALIDRRGNPLRLPYYMRKPNYTSTRVAPKNPL